MESADLTARLKEEARRLGFDLAGACPAVAPPRIKTFRQWIAAGCAGQMTYLVDRADAYEHPRHILEGVQSILMLAANYRTAEPVDAAPGHGKVARYAWGADYHDVLRTRLHALADLHRQLVPEGRVRGVVDTAPLLERQFAQLAGLGWIGKNTLLINQHLGSWIVLAALLSTERLAYDAPYEEDCCGSCRACLDACPTGALGEPYRVDARRCASCLSIELDGAVPAELRGPMGDRLLGCDACQEACPWNRKTPTSAEEAFRPAEGMNPVELADLFTADDATFLARFRHTPFARPGRRGVLRNAAIILGNRPHPAALPALVQGLRDAEPIVRDACVWAVEKYDASDCALAYGSPPA